jgi:hypothetical protein
VALEDSGFRVGERMEEQSIVRKIRTVEWPNLRKRLRFFWDVSLPEILSEGILGKDVFRADDNNPKEFSFWHFFSSALEI